MNATVSASGSKKTQSGATPFDQIATLETQEAIHVEKERAAMESESDEVREAISKKEQQAEAELKDEARKELQEYRETELAKVIKSAEREAAKETNKLDADYEGKSPEVINSLVQKCTEKDSPLFQAA